MFFRKLIQSGGDSSSALQAGRDINFNGLSYCDARQLFLDLFEQNIQRHTSQAVEIATKRASVFVENLLSRMAAQAPDCADSFSDPGMHVAVRNAEKSYAASGEDDLGEILVNLLVDRATHPAEKYVKLVLSQAVEIAPLLSSSHWNALSFVFIVREFFPHLAAIRGPEELAEKIERFVKPVIADGLPRSVMEFRHILHTNTGVQVPHERLSALLANRMRWLAARPVNVFDILAIDYRAGALLDTCTQDRTGLQFRREAFDNLATEMQLLGIPATALPAVRKIMDDSVSGKYAMEILARYCISLDELENTWSRSPLAETGLTPVGIAIAQANLRRCSESQFEIREWVQ